MKLYQNLTTMNPKIQKEGCGLMCARELASRRNDKVPATVDAMNVFVAKLPKTVLDEKFNIASWDALFAELGLKVKCRYGGADYVPREGEDVILKYALNGYEHFTLVDYDPWYPMSKAARNGTLKAKLVVKWLTGAIEKEEQKNAKSGKAAV